MSAMTFGRTDLMLPLPCMAAMTSGSPETDADLASTCTLRTFTVPGLPTLSSAAFITASAVDFELRGCNVVSKKHLRADRLAGRPLLYKLSPHRLMLELHACGLLSHWHQS